MTTNDLTEGVQYTIDRHGTVTAVVVEIALWERMLRALEDAEDRDLVERLRERLTQHPATTGAVRWTDVADDWA